MNERIKQVRIDAGLTQQQFADRIGLSRNFIAMIETGGRAPSPRTITDICREFNVSISWMQNGTGEMYVVRKAKDELWLSINSILDDADDSFRKRFVAALLDLPPEFWPELQKFIKKLAQDD